MFNNAIARIPDFWALCDGTLGTPDLRDKFIVGAGDTYSPGNTGGNVNHTHVLAGDGHQHDINEAADIAEGIDHGDVSSIEYLSGISDNGDVRPPYHGIVFIKKIKRGGL